MQHVVGPYRVDMYLPAYNIVVECDEHGHKYYDLEQERLREQYITNFLKCQWIRFNPDDKGFSIFQTANVVFQAVKAHFDSKKGL